MLYFIGGILLKGIVLVLILTGIAIGISEIEAVSELGFSPLVIGIVVGIVFGNTYGTKLDSSYSSGVVFSAKKILRFAIVLYGFRITFQEIYSVGLEGLIISSLIVVSTFVIGTVVAMRWFGLDRDTSMLTASGSSVCGAAAVLATEPVLKSEPYKSAVAVSTVVFFGTVAMFLYPAIYSSGILDLDSSQFGIYIGATVHEVAQVVAVGGAYGGDVADSAVIVKMTRVMLIVPLLIGVILFLRWFSSNGEKSGGKLSFPIFALGFVAVSGFNSLHLIPENIHSYIVDFDTLLLTVAMTALGVETKASKFKDVGLRPLYVAGVMFIWLLVGGYFITKWTTELL
jgi:uncharacterized integral membrane protein (TIGR00698 family)